ncbi:hypothetical protein [Flavobacterium sp. ZS1P14]|uniref:hypothetical protein n=1 Tax=Flavobacterium sp. ZS1P14 TaxID=3401729 RepID=UPI003AAC4531
MKKTFLQFSLVFLLFGLTTNLKASTPIKPCSEYLQSNTYEAYMYHNGNWNKGRITMRQTENGYVLSTYSFSDIYTINGQQLSGNFYADQRLTRLNPNNDLAKNYNFTHYVDIQGVKAYIIAN